jgi:hypothetical protein
MHHRVLKKLRLGFNALENLQTSMGEGGDVRLRKHMAFAGPQKFAPVE